MPNRKTHNTSAVPGKARTFEEEEKLSNVRRQEGTVNEHRQRLSKNNQEKPDTGDHKPERHRGPGRRR